MSSALLRINVAFTWEQQLAQFGVPGTSDVKPPCPLSGLSEPRTNAAALLSGSQSWEALDYFLPALALQPEGEAVSYSHYPSCLPLPPFSVMI